MPPEHPGVCEYISHFPPLSFLLVHLWKLHIYIHVQKHFTCQPPSRQPESPSRAEDSAAGTLAGSGGGEAGRTFYCCFSGAVVEP